MIAALRISMKFLRLSSLSDMASRLMGIKFQLVKRRPESKAWGSVEILRISQKGGFEKAKIFLRFSGFVSRKICSPIRTLRFNQRFLRMIL